MDMSLKNFFKTRCLCVGLGASLLLPLSVFSQTEVRKITFVDVEADDLFGESVVLTEDQIIVGSQGDDEAGLNYGAVYAFERLSGEMVSKVLPVSGTAVPGFGKKVTARGSQWLVSSSSAGRESGTVLIDFENGGMQTVLDPARTGPSSLGSALAFSEKYAAVGDRLEAGATRTQIGTIGLYERDSGQLLRQFYPESSQLSEFGSELQMSEDWLVARASIRTGGAVAIFDLETFQEVRIPFSGDGVFASAIAIAGDHVVVRARSFQDAGAYHLNLRLGGENIWLPYRGEDSDQGDRLGASVAIRDELVFLGAPYDDDLGSDSGSVYVFDRSTGEQLAKLTASDGTAGARFGTSLSVNGDAVLIGAPGGDSFSNDRQAGAAYLFDLGGLEKTVTFDDVVLEGKIRETLGQPTGEVTTRDFMRLTRLNLAGLSIGSLEVLRHALSLEELDLRGTEMGDPESGLAVINLLPVSLIYRDFELPEGIEHPAYLTGVELQGSDGAFTLMVDVRGSTEIDLDQSGVDLGDVEVLNQLLDLRRRGVRFDDAGGNVKPYAVMPQTEISVAMIDSRERIKVVLDASKSADLDGTLTRYQWSFVDGIEPVEGERVLVSFPPGITNGTLVITDDEGAVSEELDFQVAVSGNLEEETFFEVDPLASGGFWVSPGIGNGIGIGDGFALFGGREYYYGVSSGAVNLVDTATGRFIQKIVPHDGVRLDYFGDRIAVDGDLVVISAPGDDDKGERAGSVYVYRVPSCELVAKFYPEGIDDEIDDLDELSRGRFGSAVAISGNRIAASSPSPFSANAPAVSLIDMMTEESIRLIDPKGGVNSRFGASLAMSQAFLLVGSPAEGEGPGSVLVFHPETGELMRALDPAVDIPSGDYGNQVAVSDGIAIVGDQSEGDNVGSVYVFDCETGAEVAKLVPKSEGRNQFFGGSVAISGNRILVGAKEIDSIGNEVGRLLVFDLTSGNFITEVRDDSSSSFGERVAASNGVAAIGDFSSGYIYRYPGVDSQVVFEDTLVEAAVRSALDIPTGGVSISDMWDLTELEIRGATISSLSGLEWASNLELLDLRGSELLSPEEDFILLDQLKPSLSLLPQLSPSGLKLSGELVEASLATLEGGFAAVMIFGPPTRPLNLDEVGLDLTSRETLIGLRSLQVAGLELRYTGENLPPVVVLESAVTRAIDVYRAGSAMVRMNAKESFDLDGEIVEFRWRLPDGVEGASGDLWTGEFPIGSTEGSLVVVDEEGSESVEIPFSVTVERPDEGVQGAFTFRTEETQLGSTFGDALAIWGNLAVVGDRLRDGDLINEGRAYLFEVSTGKLISELKNDLESGFSLFGANLAIGGNHLLVGVPGDRANGSVTVFDSATGEQLRKISPVDESGESFLTAGDAFGSSVVVSGSFAFVGAPRTANSEGPGAAYLIEIETGETLFRLDADGVNGRNYFGREVAMNESVLVVSAHETVYVFDRETGDELLELRSDTMERVDFGASIALFGDRVLVGAPEEDVGGSADSGSAYLFDLRTGDQLAKIVAEVGNPGDEFGSAVAINEDYVFVGAPGVDYDDESNQGRVYLFETDLFQEVGGLGPVGEVTRWRLGSHLAVSGNALLAGADLVEAVQLYSLDQPVFEVAFHDAELEATLLAALGKADGPIFSNEMRRLEALDLSELDLANLSGLGFARNLNFVDLRGNARLNAEAALGILDRTVLGYFMTDFVRPEGVAVPFGVAEVSLIDGSGEVVVVSARIDWDGVVDLSAAGLDFERRETLEGLRALQVRGVNVFAGATNLKPVAEVIRATYEVDDGDRDLFEEIDFKGSDSFDVDGEVAEYHWDFEGSVGEYRGEMITVRFPIGTTRGSLKVIDNDGKISDEKVLEVVVIDPPAGTVELIDIFPGDVSSPTTRFGQAVALSDDHVLIASNPVSGPNLFKGKVPYLGERSAEISLSSLPRTQGGGFATSGRDGAVALSGTFAVVGDPTSDQFGPPESGQVRGYGIGSRSGLIDYFPSTLDQKSYFGTSVACSDDYVVGGAPGHDDGGLDSGCVFVFEANSGVELMKLMASDQVAGARFGQSVALDGDLLTVGAPGGTGAAYVFDLLDGSELRKLTPNDPGQGDGFGASLAMSGGKVLIGRPELGDGSVLLFDVVSGAEEARFAYPYQGGGAGFGRSVAISPKFILIGAPSQETVFLYERETGTQIAEVWQQEARGGSLFGASLALHGEYGLIGGPTERRNFGIGNPSLLGQVGYYRFRVPARSPLAKFEEFARREAPALTGEDLLPSAHPFDDGISNLLKYAFNLDLNRNDQRQLTEDESAGLPRGGVVEIDGKNGWQFEYLRRMGSGLLYTPEWSGSLDEEGFQIFSGSEVVEEIPGTGFERVTVTALNDVSSIRKGFYRVRVSMPD